MERFTDRDYKHRSYSSQYLTKYAAEELTKQMHKLGKFEDLEAELLKYNIDIFLFLEHVINELEQRPTLEITSFNPEFSLNSKFEILNNDMLKTVAKIEKLKEYHEGEE